VGGGGRTNGARCSGRRISLRKQEKEGFEGRSRSLRVSVVVWARCRGREKLSTPSHPSFSLTEDRLHVVPAAPHVEPGAGQQGVGERVVEFAEVVEDLERRRKRGRGWSTDRARPRRHAAAGRCGSRPGWPRRDSGRPRRAAERAQGGGRPADAPRAMRAARHAAARARPRRRTPAAEARLIPATHPLSPWTPAAPPAPRP